MWNYSTMAALVGGLVLLLFIAPVCFGKQGGWNKEKVTATTYTLAEDETKQGNVGLAAWGDHLERGDKAVAVSRDLVKQGLGHNARVRIEGVDGTFTVLDKMNRRWRKKIDILFSSKKKAREFGKQTVSIRWRPAPGKSP